MFPETGAPPIGSCISIRRGAGLIKPISAAFAKLCVGRRLQPDPGQKERRRWAAAIVLMIGNSPFVQGSSIADSLHLQGAWTSATVDLPKSNLVNTEIVRRNTAAYCAPQHGGRSTSSKISNHHHLRRTTGLPRPAAEAVQTSGRVTSDAAKRGGELAADATRRFGEAGADAINRSGQAGSDGIRQGTQHLAESQQQITASQACRPAHGRRTRPANRRSGAVP